MDYFTRKSCARAGCVGTYLSSGQYPFVEALGVRIRKGWVQTRELNCALDDLGLAAHASAAPDLEAAIAESHIQSLAGDPEKLRLDMRLFLHRLIPRTRNLTEPERSTFELWMKKYRCTAPVILGVPETEQDGFYMSDLSAFRAGLPGPD